MVFPDSFNFMEIGLLFYDGVMNLPTALCTVAIVGTLFALLIVVFKAPNTLELAKHFKADNKTVYITAALLFLSIICLSRVSAFIYFNF